ncbi:MAG: putative Ig domain-containing protein [Gemmataceae bacterium]
MHNGEVGVGYLAVTFVAAGGAPPYSWSVASGLPPGLALTPQGVFGGSNTTAGHYSFNAQVTDSTGATATGAASMTVFPPLTVSQPCAQVCYVGMGCTTCGRFGTVSGGAGPYHYKLAGGAVPSGMTLNQLALQGPFPAPLIASVPVDVVVAGPPITKFLWNLSASVTDDFGVTKTVAANFWEFFPLRGLCTSNSPCTCSGTNDCSAIAAYEFGAPADNVSVQVVQVCDANGGNCVAGTAGLPSGWSATAKGGLVNVGLDPVNGFFGQVTIDVVDHGACVAPAFAVSNQVVLSISWPGP